MNARIKNRLVDVGIPLIWFAILAIHGSGFGLTDDEAYYWVLSNKPALGYAYHPPMVAWVLASFRYLLGGVIGDHSVAVVRVASAFCSAAILAVSLRWIQSVGVIEPKRRALA